jgi:hypothetical protein
VPSVEIDAAEKSGALTSKRGVRSTLWLPLGIRRAIASSIPRDFSIKKQEEIPCAGFAGWKKSANEQKVLAGGPGVLRGRPLKLTQQGVRSGRAPRQLFLPIATIIFAGCRQG